MMTSPTLAMPFWSLTEFSIMHIIFAIILVGLIIFLIYNRRRQM
jgi:hypothetical protein